MSAATTPFLMAAASITAMQAACLPRALSGRVSAARSIPRQPAAPKSQLRATQHPRATLLAATFPIRSTRVTPSTKCQAVGDWGEQGYRKDEAPKALSLERVGSLFNAFYKFTRPHTMLGTTISIISVSLLALQGHAIDQSAITAISQALAAALMANISIVGLNQVFDVDIDRINKPYLPLASGEFSLNTGIAIVILTALAAVALSAVSGSPALLWTVVVSLILGVLYSTDLPFMRWKKFPVLAASCILAVRAVIVQLGFYFHIKYALGTAQITLTRPLLFTMAFMLLFSIVIALFKDIPDVKGDDQAGVRTFSVRHGVPSVFWTCINFLLAAYAGGVVFGLTSGNVVSAVVTAGGHLAMAALLWNTSKKVNLKKKQDLVDHYMFIWKLFYAEYLLIPFLA